jgi:hypothetical protein
MSDDDIIAKGGTQEDIESYAEANGSTNPTNTPETKVCPPHKYLPMKRTRQVSDAVYVDLHLPRKIVITNIEEVLAICEWCGDIKKEAS